MSVSHNWLRMETRASLFLIIKHGTAPLSVQGLRRWQRVPTSRRRWPSVLRQNSMHFNVHYPELCKKHAIH